ncbi:MAG: hypothetical protein M1817_001318 [Caeruleum heppii]|nr:MAG: hypothetical protein M1817_001318 [Caeruleum heppii]
MQSRWFEFGGDAIVRADQYVRLTSDRPSQAGWIFSRVPLTATNWEIEVEFKIHGNGHLYGDGMAMWLTKQRGMQGTVFGSTDRFEGLGIFFDTYKNNRPGVVFPFVMAMMGDGETSYDQANDGKANELASCSARGIRDSNFPTKARLTFFQDSHLRLELLYKNYEDWTECFNISSVTMPSVAYLGFSAHTGELSDNHDIISVDTNNLYNANPGQSRAAADSGSAGVNRGRGKAGEGNRAVTRSSGGWTWFLLKIVLFIVVCAGGYVGYAMWKTQQRRGSRF